MSANRELQLYPTELQLNKANNYHLKDVVKRFVLQDFLITFYTQQTAKISQTAKRYKYFMIKYTTKFLKIAQVKPVVAQYRMFCYVAIYQIT